MVATSPASSSISSVSLSPDVSVIVPARNEEVCLESCLRSLVSQNLVSQNLVSQTPVEFEIIVVDDHSTDRTREIASSFARAYPGRIRLIDAPALPAHWTGKNNAAAAGAKAARGRWFLFTDADTVHLSGSLSRALEEATRKKADLLSYSPEQIVESLGEKAVMPVIFAELAARYRPGKVSDPNSSAAAANGQYLLITREAYDAVGGHAAIADQILEDVALAHAVKRSGRKIFFRYAPDAVRTRMYRSFSQLREGWTKNLALLFPAPGKLAMLRLFEFLLIVVSFAVTMFELARGNRFGALVTCGLSAIIYLIFLIRIARAHFSVGSNALAIFGLPLFAYLLFRSRTFHGRGVVQWKGRTYSSYPSQPNPESLHAASNVT